MTVTDLRITLRRYSPQLGQWTDLVLSYPMPPADAWTAADVHRLLSDTFWLCHPPADAECYVTLSRAARGERRPFGDTIRVATLLPPPGRGTTWPVRPHDCGGSASCRPQALALTVIRESLGTTSPSRKPSLEVRFSVLPEEPIDVVVIDEQAGGVRPSTTYTLSLFGPQRRRRRMRRV